MTEPQSAVAPLIDRLLEAGVGGCSCDTKPPELRYHSPICHFRLHEEARAEIERLSFPSLGYECRRCGSHDTMPIVETP